MKVYMVLPLLAAALVGIGYVAQASPVQEDKRVDGLLVSLHSI